MTKTKLHHNTRLPIPAGTKLWLESRNGVIKINRAKADWWDAAAFEDLTQREVTVESDPLTGKWLVRNDNESQT